VRHPFRLLVFAFAPIAALLFTAAPALANPLSLARFGGLRADPLYTGPWAVYWNPASLAQPGWEIGLHGQIALRQASYFRDPVTNHVDPSLVGINSGLAQTSTSAFIPALAARMGFRVRDVDFGFGLAVYAGEGGAAKYDPNYAAPSRYPGAVDGPQRWNTINTRLTVINASLGAGVAYRPWGLSVGVVPVLAALQFATVRARNIDGTDDVVDMAGHLKEGRAFYEASTIDVQWIVGARWDAHPLLSLGLTWHKGANFVMEGDLHVAFGTQPPSSERARLTIPIADTYRFGGEIRLPAHVNLRPSVEWARWSILQKQVFTAVDNGASLINQERDFHDSVAGRLRVDWKPKSWLWLIGGAGYEYGPTPNKNYEPGLAEGDSIELGAGAYFDLRPGVRLGASYIWNYLLPHTVTDSVMKPTSNGRYTDQRHYILIDLEITGLGKELRKL
jgi:long-subunit fatty acid transport protein